MLAGRLSDPCDFPSLLVLGLHFSRTNSFRYSISSIFLLKSKICGLKFKIFLVLIIFENVHCKWLGSAFFEVISYRSVFAKQLAGKSVRSTGQYPWTYPDIINSRQGLQDVLGHNQVQGMDSSSFLARTVLEQSKAAFEMQQLQRLAWEEKMNSLLEVLAQQEMERRRAHDARYG